MRQYWEDRLRRNFDLTDAGYAGLGFRYNRWLYRVRLEALERGLKTIGRTFKGMRILEAGCGTGFYTEYCLQQEVNTYVGVDITSVSVETLRKQYPEFSFIQADISAESLSERVKKNFDVVLAADVLFHIVDHNAFERAIQNLCSLLCPGGLLIISDVFPVSTVQVAPHVCFRSMDEYTRLLSQNHHRILHIEPIFAILQPPPYISHVSWTWKGYALLWRFGWRLARWNMVDRLLPPGLAWLDRNLFCPRWGRQAPNSKWLFAVKD